MPQLQPKQINKIISAPIKLLNNAVNNNVASVIVTTAISSALATAGQNGVSVPVQVSTGTSGVGIVVTGPNNKTEIFDTSTKLPITDVSGNEIYGRITKVSTNYVLAFYVLSSGTETSYTTTDSINIDFDFVYRFDFNTLPSDFAVSSMTRNVNQDAKGQNSVLMIEQLTVTATNVVSVLGNIPSAPTKTILVVNGKEEYYIGSNPAFSLSGTAITWSPSNAGYSLETTDIVYVKYLL